MSGKMIEEEPTFISKSKKLELAVGAPIDNGLPPVSVDANMELNKEKIDENEVDDEEDYMPSGQGADSKINKEMKGIIDELNPKKLAEKAQQRYKTHLPAETASQLSKAMNF
jgi:hypothetical protein